MYKCQKETIIPSIWTLYWAYMLKMLRYTKNKKNVWRFMSKTIRYTKKKKHLWRFTDADWRKQALFILFLALKKTRDLKASEKEGIPLTTLKEIEFRRRLRHRNVIRLIDMKEDVDKHKRPVQYLVYEYMESDLNKYMDFQLNELNIDIPPMMIHKLMYQLLSGLAYCHKKQAMHSSISTLVSPPTSWYISVFRFMKSQLNQPD